MDTKDEVVYKGTIGKLFEKDKPSIVYVENDSLPDTPTDSNKKEEFDIVHSNVGKSIEISKVNPTIVKDGLFKPGKKKCNCDCSCSSGSSNNGNGNSIDTSDFVKRSNEFNPLVNRVIALENKVDKDTIFDPTEINNSISSIQEQITNIQNSGYDDTGLQTKINNVTTELNNLKNLVDTLPTEDKDTVYDDSAIQSSISSLVTSFNELNAYVEGLPKTDNDTVYDDTGLRSLIQGMQNQINSLPTTDNDTIYDDSELKNRVKVLEDKAIAFIANYQSTTAQEISSFLANNPHSAILVKVGSDVYTTIYSKVVSANVVMLRTISTLQGKYNIFEYTITNGSWVATNKSLESSSQTYDDTSVLQRLGALENKKYLTMADLFKLTINKTSVVFTSDTDTVEDWVNQLQTKYLVPYIINNLNASIRIPTFTINISPYTWVINEENSTEETSVDIQATFADGSVSDKFTVSFSRPYNAIVYLPLADNQGVVLNGAKAIDTGLYLDGNHRFTVKGCLKSATSQAILVGAYTSNTERTVLKILGQSNKYQMQWANNSDITAFPEGWDLTKPFEYNQDRFNADFSQNGKNIFYGHTPSLSSDFYNDNTPLYLFNQTADGIYNNGVLCYAYIYDGSSESNGTFTFIPKIKRNTLTKEETVVIMREYTSDYTSPGENVTEMTLPEGASLEIVTFE